LVDPRRSHEAAYSHLADNGFYPFIGIHGMYYEPAILAWRATIRYTQPDPGAFATYHCGNYPGDWQCHFTTTYVDPVF
jgi:hypothetical protein